MSTWRAFPSRRPCSKAVLAAATATTKVRSKNISKGVEARLASRGSRGTMRKWVRLTRRRYLGRRAKVGRRALAIEQWITRSAYVESPRLIHSPGDAAQCLEHHAIRQIRR